jgi:4-hydroxy-tetrahydrodipicolinate reductase
MANGVGRELEAIADVVPFLERGTSVVTCSLIPFVFAAIAPPEMREAVSAACTKGRSSFFNSGIDPGFATGQMVASLLALATEIESVRVQELGNFSRYGAAPIMREVFGFGQPPTFVPPLFTSGMLLHWWQGTIAEIAELLEVAIDDIVLRHEVAAVDHDVDCAFGRVEAGTIGAVRFELKGMHNGRPVIVVEHVDRIALDAAPQWDRATTTEGTAYRLVVTGRPSYTCELGFSLAGGVSGAVISTATYLVNAIAAVCAAEIGVLGTRDVPPFVGRRIRA